MQMLMLCRQRMLQTKRATRTRVFYPAWCLSSYSTIGDSSGNSLDRQIDELNQESENVFGSFVAFTKQPSSPATMNLHAKVKTQVSDYFQSTDSFNKMKSLSHVDSLGKASMVDVSEKCSSKRVAIASGRVTLGQTAFQLVSKNEISKGDVLTVAKVAGIQGAKQTANLIPLCHNIMLSNIQLNLQLNCEEHAVDIKAEVTSTGVTGVEMEALTAVSVAALTVYDMCKSVSKHVKITNIQLEAKEGGKSGDWSRTV